MRNGTRENPTMSQHLNLSLIVCTANKNHLALRMFLIVQLGV
jgi:hypothetical protein